MQVEELDEIVSVRADFSGGEITPRIFKRNGRAYRIAAVNARWGDREGARPVHHFSVQVDGDTYFLSFHTGDMLWRLSKVILPG
jgi:hypothetical protein